MNIFAHASSESRIFKNESALLPDFLPEALPGREREIKELVFCLTPAAENKQPSHALLIGPAGTGKTSSARFVIKHLSEYSSRPLCLYINCWEHQGRAAIFSFISSCLNIAMPQRGIGADEIFSRIIEIAKKEGKIPIIVLDEVDRLADTEVLYDLCRAGELHSLKTGVIAITNDEEFHLRLDKRIRSSFIQHTLYFSPYTVPQLKEILKQRASIAFFSDALSDDIVPLCAAIAYKAGGDARVALSLLLSAGKEAEREDSLKVEVHHVRRMEEEVLSSSAVKAERKLPILDEIDKKIIEIVRQAKEIKPREIYRLLSRYAKERTIRRRLEILEKSGVIVREKGMIKIKK